MGDDRKNIKQLLGRIPETQLALARVAGINRAQVNMFLRGHIDLKPEQVKKLYDGIESLKQERERIDEALKIARKGPGAASTSPRPAA